MSSVAHNQSPVPPLTSHPVRGPLVIYHAGCADGFCAAWLFRKFFPDAEFHAAHHGSDPPPVRDRDVFVVDFSYPRSTLEQMHSAARSLLVLDHHKTAEESLRGLPYCVFDMEKSGGRLAWEYLIDRFPRQARIEFNLFPWLVDYTEDRDLWLFAFPSSREVNACLRSYPMDFETWDRLHADVTPDQMAVGGAAILRDQAQTVAAKVSQAHEVSVMLPFKDPDSTIRFRLHRWLACNATTLISETAEQLAVGTGVGCCWFELANGDRVYSLRTVPKDNPLFTDVSEIARIFGGGGHAAAAGFTVPAGRQHPWSTRP